jgi:hypothetical protein
LELDEEFPMQTARAPMQKLAVERLELFQQVVQDKVLMGLVTTKNGNALRKVLSTPLV